MTAQIPDSFEFNEETYSIAGKKGESLFNPWEYGLKPKMASTACWRGYVCTYKLSGENLVLDKLSISSTETPELKGVSPTDMSERQGHSMFAYCYENVEIPVKFTGGLLLAKNFIQELYVHMGFHPAWKYKKVVELIFEEGILKESRDISGKMEKLRERMIKQGEEEPGIESGEELEEWVASTFRLDYDL
jgi:hypothetical protein